MRIMAVDLGDVRTGIAISDVTNTIVGKAWTVEERDMKRLADIIIQEIKSNCVGDVVLGNPKNMDGSEGARSEKSREFRAFLIERAENPVILWDERRTTVAAHGILHANGKKMKAHKRSVDAVAASLILEGYLGTL